MDVPIRLFASFKSKWFCGNDITDMLSDRIN